jgi:D-aminopeptidase
MTILSRIPIGTCNPGDRNSITDVTGVTVGHYALIEGAGDLVPGKGPVRTGVTAILPHQGNVYKEKVFAHYCVFNGYCKPIGLAQIKELGVLETPIVLTNTLSVGTAADAVIEYMLDKNPDIGVTTGSVNPVVLECNDSYLNDIRGKHVKKQHVLTALKNAQENFQQGAVGAGTGMSAFEFKGGIGSASRVITMLDTPVTVGALVLTNFGKREDLIIAGVPIGRELKDYPGSEDTKKEGTKESAGSIIMVVATDAVVIPSQLKRIARRAIIGLARTGGGIHHGSGDVAIAFSTGQVVPHDAGHVLPIKEFPDHVLSLLFKAAAEAVEEAIIRSLVEAETVKGRDNRIRYHIPEEKVIKIMEKYGRLNP